MPIGRIQREARGLLQYLDIIGQTQRPIALDDFIRGTLDMTPFYGAEILQAAFQAGTVQNVNDAIDLVVPAGEAWMLLGAEALTTLGAAGEDVLGGLGIVTANSGFISLAADSRAISAGFALGDRISLAMSLEHPLVLTAGFTVRYQVYATTLGAARVSGVTVLIYRFAL